MTLSTDFVLAQRTERNAEMHYKECEIFINDKKLPCRPCKLDLRRDLTYTCVFNPRERELWSIKSQVSFISLLGGVGLVTISRTELLTMGIVILTYLTELLYR